MAFTSSLLTLLKQISGPPMPPKEEKTFLYLIYQQSQGEISWMFQSRVCLISDLTFYITCKIEKKVIFSRWKYANWVSGFRVKNKTNILIKVRLPFANFNE